MHQRKREAFMERIRGGVAIFPSAVPSHRNHDTEYKYRQESNFYYLTGFEEPHAVCVLAPDHPEHKYILFVRPKKWEEEIWTGQRAGLEGAKAKFGADEAYAIEEFDEKISNYLDTADVIYYSFGFDETFNSKVVALLRKYSQRRISVKVGRGPNTLIDPTEILGDMRLIKDAEELRRIRRATEISVEAHLAAMKTVRPGLYEYELEALVNGVFRRHEGSYAAFPTIVASGVNATILHYTANDCEIKDGDLALLDAGCEYQYYNGDITRTFPANGRFSDVQREVYQMVLDTHMTLIDMIRPGVSIDEPHQKAVELLTDAMLQLGWLKGDKAELIKEEKYKQFFMYRIGHMLGVDVHDVTKAREGDTFRTFQPGMVMTVEPGLYVAPHTENVPEQYLGIGIRIEDDVLVTESGCEALTAGVPNSIEGIEALMAKAKGGS